jgi:hypothetical protein
MTMQWAVRPQPLDSRASANQGSGFLPTQLPGLMFWTDSAFGITQAAGLVSNWADISGNGNSFAQGTGANQPAYTASDAAYGGRPSLTFVSTNPNWMDMQNALPIIVQPMTVYCVGNISSNAAASDFFDKANGAIGRMLLASSIGANTVAIFAGSTVGPAGSVAAPSVIGCVFNSPTCSLLINASQAPIATGDTGATGLNKFEIGGFSGGTASQMNGKLASFLVYSAAHTPAQIQQVFAYLGARFGIAVS